jgi:hypothetical protein
MSSRASRFTQAEANRLFKAAITAGVSVRLELQLDGTIVATTDTHSELKEGNYPGWFAARSARLAVIGVELLGK